MPINIAMDVETCECRKKGGKEGWGEEEGKEKKRE